MRGGRFKNQGFRGGGNGQQQPQIRYPGLPQNDKLLKWRRPAWPQSSDGTPYSLS